MDRISIWWNEMLEKEIEEFKGAISNERLMELGYSGKGSNPHTQNIIVMQTYISQLESAKKNITRKEKGEKTMKVLRKHELETDIIEVGDQITIKLAGFGEFTATAQKITDKGTLFLFDDCVARHPMNEIYTNKGGYEHSDLRDWINTELFNAFPDDVKPRVSELAIPTYGQMFGHDDWYEDVMEFDNDEQLPLIMKKSKNRIADYDDCGCWYWLKNATKKSVSFESFAVVTDFGDASYTTAGNCYGIRPIFLLA
jgi:hypothetical protein